MLYSLTEDEQATRRFYSVLAQTYAEKESPSEVDSAMFDWSACLPENPLVLDVGCGAGRTMNTLAEVGIKRYIGIDPCPELLTIVREKYPQADFRLGEARDIPAIVTEICDGFIAGFSLTHLAREHMQDALVAIRSRLAVGAAGFVIGPVGKGERRATSATNALIPADQYAVFTEWTLDAFHETAERAGFEPKFLLCGEDGYRYWSILLAR